MSRGVRLSSRSSAARVTPESGWRSQARGAVHGASAASEELPYQGYCVLVRRVALVQLAYATGAPHPDA